jgi:hypothetical protein
MSPKYGIIEGDLRQEWRILEFLRSAHMGGRPYSCAVLSK